MLTELTIIGAGAALLGRRKRRRASKLLRAARAGTGSSASAEAASTTATQRFSLRTLVRDLRLAITGDEREQQQGILDSGMRDAEEARKRNASRNLLLSTGAVGLGLLGTVSPLFYLLGSLGVIYLGRHVFRALWSNIKRRHFISVYLVSAILMVGMLATGQLLLAATAGLFGGFLVTLIKKAEQSSEQRLTEVFANHPGEVWLERNGMETRVPFDSLRRGDILVLHAGEVIPVDGIIRSGSASIDQHVLTGESQPVDRSEGEPVFAATLVLAGRITVMVETAGDETIAAGIGKVLNTTKRYTDNVMLRGRKIADRLLPVELGAGLLTFLLAGATPAIAVLWSGLGYRMIMFGPISVLNYLQLLSRRGILVKDGRVLESLRSVDTVVFDKTGTLTIEQPVISAIHRFSSHDEGRILQLAASAEHRQTHPVAQAILGKAAELGLPLLIPDASSYEVGYGIRVRIAGQAVRVGSARFMQREGLAMPDEVNALEERSRGLGHSLIYVGIDDAVAGVLEMQPSLRPEAQQVMDFLRKRGMTTYIISGDHEEPTRRVAEQLGVDHYFAQTLPEHKAELVKRLRDEGRFVCFIGDGINDAIALKSAQTSISLKGASSAATDTAQIVFMDGTLAPLPSLFKLADEFERTMHGNLVLSVVPGVFNIAGIYLLHIGIVVSVTLFYAGTAAGLANSILPLLRHQQNQPETDPPDGAREPDDESPRCMSPGARQSIPERTPRA